MIKRKVRIKEERIVYRSARAPYGFYVPSCKSERLYFTTTTTTTTKE